MNSLSFNNCLNWRWLREWPMITFTVFVTKISTWSKFRIFEHKYVLTCCSIRHGDQCNQFFINVKFVVTISDEDCKLCYSSDINGLINCKCSNFNDSAFKCCFKSLHMFSSANVSGQWNIFEQACLLWTTISAIFAKYCFIKSPSV